MKLAEFRKVLEAAVQFYRDSGNDKAAESLIAFSGLVAGRETMTVPVFAGLIAKVVEVEATHE